MTARHPSFFTCPTPVQKYLVGGAITLVLLGLGWIFFADPATKPLPSPAEPTPQINASQLQPAPAPAATSVATPHVAAPTPMPPATPETPFTPLLPGSEHESFKDYAISAMAAGTSPGSGIAVVNGKILHEGDKLGLAQLVRIQSDSLIFLFDKRYYVLYPRQESAAEHTPSPSRKGKP